MNPAAEKSQPNEFKVSVKTPSQQPGMVKMPETKKGGGFFKRAGSWLGVEAVYTPETPTEQKTQDFSIADTVTPIDASQPKGVPDGVSNGLETPTVPQAFQDATQDLNLNPSQPVSSAELSGSGVSAVPSEDQKFTLDPQAIKPVNSASGSSEVVAPAPAPQQGVPQAFQDAAQGVNLDPATPAPAEPTVSAPPVSEVPKAFDEGLKNVNLDPAVPPVVEPVTSTPTTAETPPVSVQPEPLAKGIVEPVNSGAVASETHEDEGPTAATLEHPAIPAPSSLDSVSSAPQTELEGSDNNMADVASEDKKAEPDEEKPAADLEGVSREEPLLFAEQGAVEEGVLPGADATLTQSPELSETEKKERDEKLGITGKAIDAMETQTAKDENSRWIVEEAPAVAQVKSSEESGEKQGGVDPFADMVFNEDPSKFVKITEDGQATLDENALDEAILKFKRDPKNVLILVHSNPSLKSKLEQRGIKLKPLDELQKAA